MSGFAMWRNFEMCTGRGASVAVDSPPRLISFTFAEPEKEIVWGLRAH